MVAGVVAGALVVGSPVGLGLLLSALAIAAAVEVQRPRPMGFWPLSWGVLAVALVATAAVSSAEWTVGPAVLAAAGFAAVSLTPGSTWAGLRRGALAPLAAIGGAIRVLGGVVTGRFRGRALRRAAPALRGAGLALALTAVFGVLFTSADAAFAELVDQYLLPDWDLDLLPARVFVGVVAALAATALALAPARHRDVDVDRPGPAPRLRLRAVEWLTALLALDALFAGFVAVQITVLFGGHAHVLETVGLTYAEYARAGFFQLLLAAALTVAVIAGALRWADLAAFRDRTIMRVLLGLLCVLSLVVLASALRRLSLYEQAFGFTRSRMLAHAVLLWLGALFTLLLMAGAIWDGRWLPRATLIVTGIAVLSFAAVRPDALVAEHNVARYLETARIDLAYLDTLSADAVPALARLPEPLRGCVLADDAARLARPEPWYAFNLGRQQARRVLVTIDLPARRAGCPRGG